MSIPDLKLVVIDTETGGPDATEHSLLSIALVVWDQRIESPVFDRLINEGNLMVTPEGMANNRIDLAAIAQVGLSPVDAVDELEAFVRQHCHGNDLATLAGHNVGFDIGFLKRLYRLARRNYGQVFSHRSFDTVSVLRYLRLTGLLELPDESSDTAFAHFDLQPRPEKRHQAAADVVATANLISRLVTLGQPRVDDPKGV